MHAAVEPHVEGHTISNTLRSSPARLSTVIASQGWAEARSSASKVCPPACLSAMGQQPVCRLDEVLMQMPAKPHTSEARSSWARFLQPQLIDQQVNSRPHTACAHLSISYRVWQSCETWQLTVPLLPWCLGLQASRSSASTCSTAFQHQQAASTVADLVNLRATGLTAFNVRNPHSARRRKPSPRNGACRKHPGGWTTSRGACSESTFASCTMAADLWVSGTGFAALGGPRSADSSGLGRSVCP